MKNGGKTAKAAKNGKKRWKNGETAKNCEKRQKLFWVALGRKQSRCKYE